MTNYAEVFPSNGMWNVRYTSQPERSRVRALFGTDEIPTAFSTHMSFDEVFSVLRSIPANRDTCFVQACA